jgi:hypothetical protein
VYLSGLTIKNLCNNTHLYSNGILTENTGKQEKQNIDKYKQGKDNTHFSNLSN